MVTSPQGLNVRRMQSLWPSTSFFILRGILLPVFFNVCTSADPVDALKVQSSNPNTKVSRVQVHSLNEGPTKGLGVRLSVDALSFLRIAISGKKLKVIYPINNYDF